MDHGFTYWIIIFLHHLITVLYAHGGEAARDNISKQHLIDDLVLQEGNNIVLRLHSTDDESHKLMPMSHMDTSLTVFVMLDNLKTGNVIPIYFPKRDPSTSPHLLPREEADSIPFSSHQLPQLLHLFSSPEGSPQAKAMEDTLRQCETPPIVGETKTCATSLESMVDFARGVFGLDSRMRVLSTTHLTKSTKHLQNYTVLGVPMEISAPKAVACHTMPYPYAVFYCHYQRSESRVFEVSLRGENGDLVVAIAVCHMDTSHWSRGHVSFRVLGVEPGASPVCHFFPGDHLVWIPLPATY